ncbi:MAG: type III-A CRISPR-associated protein Cas10/Csm1 [bacterium]
MYSNQKEYQEYQGIVLASLLHDIGKFKQRVELDEDKGKSHTEIGHAWLASHYGEGVIAAGARDHHGNEAETWLSNASLIFYEADNCAASERKTEFDPKGDVGKTWYRKIQLANVFSRVRNPHADEIRDNGLENSIRLSYYSLSPLGGWIVPQANAGENSSQAYKNLWDTFEDEFFKIKTINNHLNIDIILHLLEKYTSFIPSITLKVYSGTDEETYRKHPDISLFDHLKVTAGVAACLYHYYRHYHSKQWEQEILREEITGDNTWNKNHQPFLLIGGDLSGVQRFIYTISSKGALKMLKGRSFFLELLTEHIVDRLLEDIELTRCNVVFTGGGHFYLMAPNTPNARKSMENVREKINNYLFDSFNGSLQQHIEAVPFSKVDFKNASGIWGELSACLENSKRHKWRNRLNSLFSSPAMPHEKCLMENCQICGREDKPLQPLVDEILDAAKSEVMACEHCRDQYLLGHLLQSAIKRGSYPIIYRWDREPDRKDRFVKIGNRYYQPAAGVFGIQKEKMAAQASAVYHLNDWNLGHYIHPGSRPLLAGIYLPEDSRLQDLNGMTQYGFGIEQLAILRMDVDRLGRIFSTSIPSGERTISRMASLSRQLSLFFKYHINGLLEHNNPGYPPPFRIVERQGERNLSIVYSGGDDLFLIGHWLDITEAAFEIKRAFQQFTANPYITLSAGIALGDNHVPVYRLAEAAGSAEELAKGNRRKSITLFGKHTFQWDDAEAMIKDEETTTGIVKTILGLCLPKDDRLSLPVGSVTRGVLYKLLAITREHKQEKVWILPKLAYVFGRFRPSQEFNIPWKSLQDYVFLNSANWQLHWHCLEIALLWNLMMMRKGGEI